MTAISSGLVPSPALAWLMFGAAVEQRRGGFDVALTRRVMQRRHAALGGHRRIDLFRVEVARVRIDRRVRIAAAEPCRTQQISRAAWIAACTWLGVGLGFGSLADEAFDHLALTIRGGAIELRCFARSMDLGRCVRDRRRA